MGIDVKDFRRALSKFPTGVTVITTMTPDKEPIGVTASSFNSVSIDPPLILWSIDKQSYSLESFEKNGHFAVNVLGSNQVEISNRFASRGKDKFGGVGYDNGLGDCPLFSGCAAQFECKTWATYEGGDHLILVGEVLRYRYDDVCSPLVFSRGSYAISAIHPEMPQSDVLRKDGSEMDFVGDYLLYLLREAYNVYSRALYPQLKKECGVNAEEWRVLASLSGQVSMPIKALASIVMQPENSLRETLDWMEEKGYVNSRDINAISLTEVGVKQAKILVDIAQRHEQNILSGLPIEHAKTLKTTLRKMIAV